MRRLILFALLASVAGAQTTITIGNTIAVANVQRPGMTLGGNLEYSQAQMLKSLNYINFGYIPGQYWQESFTCDTGTTQTTTAWTNNVTDSVGFPTGFWIGATYTAVHQTGTVLGTGTITASTANTGSSGTTFTLGTPLSAPCTAGTNTANSDLLIVRLRAPSTGLTAAQMYPSNSGTLGYSSDVSPASTNTLQSLSLSSAGTVTFFLDQQVGYPVGTGGVTGPYSFININGSFTQTYKAKCTGSAGTMNIALGRVGGTSFVSTTDTLTCGASGSGWQTFNHTFTGAETGSQTSTLQYRFTCTATGGVCLIQDADVIEGSTLAGNTTPFRDDVVRTLQKIKPGSLRLMTPPSWCSDEADQTAAIGMRRACGISNFVMNSVNVSIGYDDFLQLCSLIGTDAWITMGHFNNPADYAAMVTWLGTSGWTATFLSKALHIFLEDGNEPWNPGAAGQQASGDGSGYGVLTGAKNAAARGASGYNGSVIKLVSDGWASRSQAYTTGGGWTNSMLVAAGCTTGNANCPDYVDYAPYTLGELDNITDPFTDEQAQVQNWDSAPCVPTSCTADSMVAAATFLSTRGLTGAYYESGQGIDTGSATPTQLQMNQISSGVGEALNATEHELLAVRDAHIYGPRNEFAFVDQPFNGSNVNSTSQTSWTAPAYMMCGPGQLTTCTSVLRPLGIAYSVMNQGIGSNTNTMTISQSGTPTFSYAGGQGGSIAANASVKYVNAFAYGDGAGHYSLIAYNNNETTNEPITLAGAGKPIGSVQKTVFGGPVNAITDNNVNSVSFNNPAAVVGVPTASTLGSLTTDTLPAASMTVYAWDNTAGGNWYVLKGATGAGNGTDWTNAWTDLSSINWTSVQCGDTVWIGGGSYTTSTSLTKTCTSGSPLTVQSVISSDSIPTAAAGYTTAVLNQVLITQNSFDIDGAYITLSGRKGTPGTGSSFGIKFLCTTSCVLSEVGTSANSSNITESYLYMQGPPCVFDNGGGSGIGSCTNPVHAIQHGSATVANMVMDHLWLSGFAETIQLYQWTNWMLQYSQVDTIGQTVNEHEDLIYAANPSDGTIRYSTFFSSPNDGIFFDFGGNSLTFYRNVMYHLGGAAITFKAGYTNGSFIAYNNTFSSDTTYGDFRCPSNCPNVITQGTPTTLVFKNNVFDHVGIDGGAGSTSNYNAFSTDIGKDDSGANSFTYTSAFPPSNTQFINISTSTPQASNYRLTSTGITAFAPGTNLGTPYNIDMDGTVAPFTGAWEIGAFQPGIAPATNPVVVGGSFHVGGSVVWK